MLAWSMGKLTRTGALFPTGLTQRLTFANPKPMQLVTRFITQPLQGLPLMTHCFGTRFKAPVQFHVGAQLGQNANLQAFPDAPLGFQIDIGHVGQNNVRQPVQLALANEQAGTQKQRVPTMARRNPGNQRRQQHPLSVGIEP